MIPKEKLEIPLALREIWKLMLESLKLKS